MTRRVIYASLAMLAYGMLQIFVLPPLFWIGG
jgi:hypothetical protein